MIKMYIYKIANFINNKCYIGKDSKPKNKQTRWKDHCRNYKLHLKYKSKLYRAMRKYGLENFHFEILEETTNPYDLMLLEYEYIKKFDSIKKGYNILPGDLTSNIPLSKDDFKTLIDKKKAGSKKANIKRWKNISDADRALFGQKIQKAMSHRNMSNEVQNYWNNLNLEEKNIRIRALRNYWQTIDPKIKKKRQQIAKTNGLAALKNTAIEYKIVSPKGEEYQIFGIKKFCKDHNIDNSFKFKSVADGKRDHYCGWKCSYVSTNKSKFIRKGNANKALTYTFLTPHDTMIIIKNLKAFCKENKLAEGCMRKVYTGKQFSHRGWKKFNEPTI